MAIPRVLEGFDVAAAVARMLDDEVLWWQSFGLFIEHYADWPGQWEISRAALRDELKQVHSLRSAAANVGAVRLAAAAEALEDALSADHPCAPAVLDGLRLALRITHEHTWRLAEAALRDETA